MGRRSLKLRQVKASQDNKEKVRKDSISDLGTLLSSYRSSLREQASSSCSLASQHPPQGTEGGLVGKKQCHHVTSRVPLLYFPFGS